MRRIPVVPTMIVMLAVAIMIGLGFWQLQRRAEKHALLARFAEAAATPDEIDWTGRDPERAPLYRKARLICSRTAPARAVAGRNAADEAGWAQVQDCTMAGGAVIPVVVGWTRGPYGDGAVAPGAKAVRWWNGGLVHGVIAPGPRLVADPPLGGLQANALPDPSQLSDNHLSYAVQWFAFALAALVIYALVLRKRLQG